MVAFLKDEQLEAVLCTANFVINAVNIRLRRKGGKWNSIGWATPVDGDNDTPPPNTYAVYWYRNVLKSGKSRSDSGK